MTKSLSKIVKSGFISFGEQKKEIKSIHRNDPKVIQSSLKSVQTVEESYREEQEALMLQVQQEAYEKGFEQGKNDGFEQGKQEGYDVGYNEGSLVAQKAFEESVEKELEAQSKELDKMRQEALKDIEREKKEIEPKMLSIVENLIRKLIGVQSVSKGTIMYLIHTGMGELDVHGDLVIRISSEDIDEVLEKKKVITEGLSEKIDVEILLDQQLKKNECIIETNMGNIDCSLGTQMEALLQEIRLIRDSLKGDGLHA